MKIRKKRKTIRVPRQAFINELRMKSLHCHTCGIEYCVPEHWHEIQCQQGRAIRCPNGHKNKYVGFSGVIDLFKDAERVESLTAENAQLKRQLFQSIHEQEQSEARSQTPGTSQE